MRLFLVDKYEVVFGIHLRETRHSHGMFSGKVNDAWYPDKLKEAVFSVSSSSMVVLHGKHDCLYLEHFQGTI
jgi:hypothetical protein